MTGNGGRTGEGVRGEDASDTREALNEESEMRYLGCLPRADVDQIGAYLRGAGGNDDGDDGDDGDDDEADDGEDEHHADRKEIDDGDESSETEICIHRIQSGERIHVRVRIRDGRIERCDVSRADHDEREAEVFMQATDANDDADMTGRLELEERVDRTRIQVDIEHATAGRQLELVVVDPDGSEESLGFSTVDAAGKAEWDLDTQVGSALPFGAGSIAELEGFDFEVRDGTDGTTLLHTKAPELPASAPSNEGPGGPSDGASKTRVRGKARLTADAPGLQGYVEVRSRPDEGREVLQIEAEGLATGRVVELFVEDTANPSTYVSLGTRTADAEGELELELDTRDGATLPGGATDVAELERLGVEVRDAATGDLLLHGAVPAAHSD